MCVHVACISGFVGLLQRVNDEVEVDVEVGTYSSIEIPTDGDM